MNKKPVFNRWEEREGEILEFLKEPRTNQDLRDFFQQASLPYSKNKYIMPLVRAEKVKMLHPNSTTRRQRFISTTSDIDLVEWEMMKGDKIRKTPDRILQMCNKALTVGEIINKLQTGQGLLKESTIQKHVQPLLESGALTIFNGKYIRPDCLMSERIYDEAKVFFKTPKTSQEMAQYFKLSVSWQAQRYMNDFIEKGIVRNVNLMSKGFRQDFYLTNYIDIEPLTEQGILDYCRTPRKSTEVTKHFGICGRMMMRHYIDELVKEGKLQPTFQYKIKPELQRYVIAGAPTFSEQSLMEYCKVPHGSGEIAKYFGITNARLYPLLDKWREEGKLKFTKATKHASKQKYMTVA